MNRRTCRVCGAVSIDLTAAEEPSYASWVLNAMREPGSTFS
jgi:hypothetical protein